MQKRWKELALIHDLDISVSGIPAITSYKFNSRNSLEYKTLITQEMLKKGFLASTNFYACTDHSFKYLDMYFSALDEIFKKIKKCESEILDLATLLEGPICHSGFKRLN
tara:strand:- start:686 stop:1012 length:327 start_codon:yes stop_codon:yes gene_type:complete